MVAIIRIEVGELQLICCDACNWSTFAFVGPRCPQCGSEFDEVILTLSDRQFAARKRQQAEGAA